MQNSLPQDCARFSSMLDDRLDGVLSEDQKAFMDEHAKNCSACAERMRLSREIHSFMNGLDDGIAVPLEAQSAWRKAVRKEAAQKKNRRWVRAVSGIAAAAVVLFGCTVWMRQNGTLNTYALATDAQSAQALHSQKRIAASASDSFAWETPLRMNAPAFVESDGDIVFDNDEAPIAASNETAYETAESVAETEEAALMLVKSAHRVAQTDSYEKDRENLISLVDEYGGFMASDETGISENGINRKSVSEIRVPAALLEEFLTALENVGTTVSVQVKNDDVSTYYFDAEARLITQQAIVNRLNELIMSAKTDEIKSLNQQLNDAYNEIDDLKSVMQSYRNEVSYAEVRMELYEGKAVSVSKPAPTKEPTLSERSASGFRQSMNKVKAFFEDMIVSTAIIAPVAFVALGVAAIVLVAVYLIKRSKKSTGKGDDKE